MEPSWYLALTERSPRSYGLLARENAKQRQRRRLVAIHILGSLRTKALYNSQNCCPYVMYKRDEDMNQMKLHFPQHLNTS